MNALKTLSGFLQPWVCPDWVPKSIPNIPSNKFKLANLPTPIETWDFNTFTEANPDYELFIKRDDQTGAALTGNKGLVFFKLQKEKLSKMILR